MSRTFRTRLFLAGSLALLAVGPAAAQQYTPFYQQPQGTPFPRPAISPYLNLVRPGSPAANYYLLVQPLQRQPIINQQLGLGLTDLERRQATGEPAEPTPEEVFKPLPGTGHPAGFVFYGNYFPQSTARRAASSPAPGAPPGQTGQPRR